MILDSILTMLLGACVLALGYLVGLIVRDWNAKRPHNHFRIDPGYCPLCRVSYGSERGRLEHFCPAFTHLKTQHATNQATRRIRWTR